MCVCVGVCFTHMLLSLRMPLGKVISSSWWPVPTDTQCRYQTELCTAMERFLIRKVSTQQAGTHTHAHITNIYIHAHTIHTYAHAYIHMHTQYTHMHMHTYTCTHNTHICTCIHTHARTHTHTHTHTHRAPKQMQPLKSMKCIYGHLFCSVTPAHLPRPLMPFPLLSLALCSIFCSGHSSTSSTRCCHGEECV